MCAYPNDIPSLKARAREVLGERRLAHTLGCAETAGRLALRYGISADDAVRAALLHDITKELSVEEQLQICERYAIIPDEQEARSGALLHSISASAEAEHAYAMPAHIVRAIRLHTTGGAEMTALDRVVCLADYIEPTRDFPGVEALRETAAKDPDRALYDALCGTVRHLRERGAQIHPRTACAVASLGKELGIPAEPESPCPRS